MALCIVKGFAPINKSKKYKKCMTIRKINDNITRADLVVDRDFFNLRRTVVGYLHTISYHTSVLSVGRLGLGPLASGHWACRLKAVGPTYYWNCCFPLFALCCVVAGRTNSKLKTWPYLRLALPLIITAI